MNRRELTQVLGALPALGALLDALRDGPIELRLDAEALWRRPRVVIELAAAGARERAAARAALPRSSPALSGAGRLVVELVKGRPSGALVERDGARPRLAYRRGCLGEPALDAALWALHGLYPIGELVADRDGLELSLARPAPLPFFLALDLARPFAARAAELADRLGARAVSRLALRGGGMEIGLA